VLVSTRSAGMAAWWWGEDSRHWGRSVLSVRPRRGLGPEGLCAKSPRRASPRAGDD